MTDKKMLSLHMITLNAEETIQTCLYSALSMGIIDEVCIADTGSTDKTKELIEETVSNYPDVDLKIIDHVPERPHPENGWLNDFGSARNAALDLCTGEYILWLDADDVIENADEMVRIIDERLFQGEATWLRMLYKYQWLGEMCVDALPRERVWKNGYGRWIWPVHEVCKPQRPLNVHDASGTEQYPATFWIRHRGTHEATQSSAERNLWIMEDYREHGGQMSARMWWNLADAKRANQDSEGAETAYREGLACNTNDEERYIMTMRLGDCCRMRGDADEGLNQYALATAVMPYRKEAFFRLAEYCADLSLHQEALSWAAIGEEVREHPLLVEQFNPTEQIIVPNFTRARVAMDVGDYHRAGEYLMKVQRDAPGIKAVHEMLEKCQAKLVEERTGKAFEAILQSDMPPDHRQALMTMAPLTVPGAAQYQRATTKAVLDKQTVAIMCGTPHEAWGPEDLETGLGGSEEAVVFLSRELVKLGYHVMVFAKPHRSGEDDHGVYWYDAGTWSQKEEVDFALAWRNPAIVDAMPGARHIYMWLHDVVQHEWYTEELAERLDGVFCLSKFHARPFKGTPIEGQVIQTENGLDPEYFCDGPNDPKQIIYCSSPDRGVEQLLEMWPTIRKETGATLHHFYGFTKNYEMASRTNRDLRRLRQSVERLLRQDGVVDHGWVGHEELATAMANCGFWAYPTSWPETSCITSMKCQALGAIPVTSRFIDSGVPETTKYDLGPDPRPGMISQDPEWLGLWCQRMIEVIGNGVEGRYDELRADMKSWARDTFSWAKVGTQFKEVFDGAASGDESGAEVAAGSESSVSG